MEAPYWPEPHGPTGVAGNWCASLERTAGVPARVRSNRHWCGLAGAAV